MAAEARAIQHESVLYSEVLALLAVRPGGSYIDATVGNGGHAAMILEQSAPDGRLLALDADPDALVVAAERLSPFAGRAVLAHSNFARLAETAQAHGFLAVDGVLFDLGLSSRQLSAQGRGFAFQEESVLDMRLDPAQPTTAADLVNGLPEYELANLIFKLGDEQASRRIARAIVAARPLHTTQELAGVIERSVGRRGKIHPATRTFMALRIAVNSEGPSLEAALPQAVSLLVDGGRLAVIAFHSGEARVVKEFMRRESRDCICPPSAPVCVCGHRAILSIVTRHGVAAGDDERRRNPRSRSAILRVAEKLPNQP